MSGSYPRTTQRCSRAQRIRRKFVWNPGDLRHGIHHPAVLTERHQIGRRRKVAVPQIVVDDLIMPQQPAGRCFQCQQTVGIEIGALPVTAPEIRCR